jgi:hypothetical protein
MDGYSNWRMQILQAITTQISVDNLVGNLTGTASNAITLEVTTLTNDIFKNRDHLDDTVKEFLKNLAEW